jgi:hypothetical protein
VQWKDSPSPRAGHRHWPVIAGPAEAKLVAFDLPGEPAVGEGAPDEDTHAELLGEQEDVRFDGALEDRVGDLFGREAGQSSLLGNPFASTMMCAGKAEEPKLRILPARWKSVSAPRVSSRLVSQSGRWIWYRSM